MSYKYAVMYQEFSDFLGSGAEYVDKKVILKGLTESEISQFTGEVNRVDQLGFNPTDDPELAGLSTAQLSGIINQLVNQPPNDKMAILSKEQGKWLYANHVDFKPVEVGV